MPGYRKKAEEEVKKAAEAAKKGNIGGHIDPKQPGKNPEAYDILLKNAENKRDGYLKKAEEEVKKAAEAAKKG